MTKRRTITAALERRIIMAQLAEGYIWYRAADGEAALSCPYCWAPLYPETSVIHEHMTPLCMGGADDETNIRLVHRECANRKTNGTKATSYGSDSHAKAKVDRITGVTGQRKWKRKWPSRKLPSVPFNREK